MSDRVFNAAKALLDDVRRRYPGEDLKCPFMRELDAAVDEAEALARAEANAGEPERPKHSFNDTFSAESVLLDHYFPAPQPSGPVEALVELLDDLPPNESVGAYGGSGQWVEIATVQDLRSALTSSKPDAPQPSGPVEDWDGLDCSCGGGWKVGHRAGCPEANAGVPVADADIAGAMAKADWSGVSIGNKALIRAAISRLTHPTPQPSGPVVALEDKREEMLATVTPPDNAPASAVLAYVLSCASMWEPSARIIGNARAGDIVRAISALTAGKPEQVPSDEHRYAVRLLIALMEKHYPDRWPEWAPLPDLMGILTQIDNLTTGLVRAAPTAGGGDAE